MKKKKLKKLALLGISSGIALSQTVQANEKPESLTHTTLILAANTSKSTTVPSNTTNTSDNANEGNLGYHLMTEDELMLELNAEGQRMYNALDAKNKQLALQVASGRCANTNFCQGLNACKTDKNNCAGQAACKGNGKCGIADKNLAVRLVYNKMMKKRTAINNGE